MVPFSSTLVEVVLSWVSMRPASKVLLMPDALVDGIRVMFRMMSSCLPSLEVLLKGAVTIGVVCKPGGGEQAICMVAVIGYRIATWTVAKHIPVGPIWGVLEMMGFCADLVQCVSKGSGLEGGEGLGVAMAWV
ncbi:MAG: hypothetical protein FRX49_05383 [Trebouxia sp. A1-2]|nr:MAG: hypothetical protein FRX49_05383 [Trebouxia sp. A1-2]